MAAALVPAPSAAATPFKVLFMLVAAASCHYFVERHACTSRVAFLAALFALLHASFWSVHLAY